MSNERIVLITGATGQQGGSILRELAGKGFKLRAMTRHPDGEAAGKLAKLGAEVVQGDLDDAASVRKCLDGAWGTFAIQNTWEAGVEREEEQGKRFAKLAREAGIQHYVYASVASANRRTGIPHFENKWRIEELVRSLDFPSHVILRPVFFMENLVTPWFLSDGKLMTAMKPETKLQMVAVRDIGRIGAHAFTHAAEMKGEELDFAGDEATMPRAAEVLGEAMGRKIPFVPIPVEEVRKNSDEFAIMLEWFDRVGYNADIPALDKRFGKMIRLDEWAGETVKV
jgi:uncharacterized protein YbjT (DUF2867 family)